MAQRHDPRKNLVGFVVGDAHYAVPIARVREIAQPLDVVAMPHARAEVIGVADYRGEVVAVIDLRARFGLAAVPTTRRTKWILVDLPGAAVTVALVVDGVTEVFAGADMRPSPAVGGEDRRGVAGVTTYHGTMVFVLDPSRLEGLVEPHVVAALGVGGAA